MQHQPQLPDATADGADLHLAGEGPLARLVPDTVVLEWDVERRTSGVSIDARAYAQAGVDPLAGWLLGNVLGFAAYKTFLKLPPAGMAAICLVLVALSPVIFLKYPAMGAFFAALAIDIGAGSIIHRTLIERRTH